MGTRVAPNFANVYMGRFEDKFVYQTEWANWLIMCVRFIDDILLIWKGDKDSLIDFLDYLNNVVPSIKFTHEISTDSVNFLDTTVLKDEQGYINTDVASQTDLLACLQRWTRMQILGIRRTSTFVILNSTQECPDEVIYVPSLHNIKGCLQALTLQITDLSIKLAINSKAFTSGIIHWICTLS